jgi:polysaccharide export outer membrane protein
MTSVPIRFLLLLAALASAACAPITGPGPRQAREAFVAPAPVPRATKPLADAYRLGPGDMVEIAVYNNPDLTTKTSIGEDGTISFPLIGNVALAGLTRAEAEKRIAHGLEAGKFVPKPYVNLVISEYRSQTISVLGDVSKPGTYQIRRPIKVTEVLAMAGGITPKGSQQVTLVSKGANGGSRRQTVDVSDVLQRGDLAQDALVRNGDIVYVPPAPKFYIYGEVRDPGAYPLQDGMTVQQALSVGGGLTVRGTQRGIQVDRKLADGSVHSYSARLSDRLKPGDVVQVPQSWF